jgi:hypothetical protein
MSDYTKGLEFVKKAKDLVVNAEKGRETIPATTIDLEVITEEYVTKRIEDFKKAAYLDQHEAKRWKKAKVKFGEFETITRVKKNMAAGFRWTSVLTTSGKELIDPTQIVEADKVRLLYINHNRGVTDEMSIFEQDIPLVENVDNEVIASAKGEATLYFYPGYEKYELFRSDENQEINFNGVACFVKTIGKHYCNFIFNKETYKKPTVVAYNKEGVKLNRDYWVLHSLYANDTTAEDYTEETFPNKDEVKKRSYFALFDGEIDRLELYFQREWEMRVVPLKTIDHLPEDFGWEDYKTVPTGITKIAGDITQYEHLSQEAVNDHFYAKVVRSASLSNPNEPQLQLNLPESNNSCMALSRFKSFKFQEKQRDAMPISFNYSSRNICDFSYKNIAHESDFDRNLNIMAGEGQFTGNVHVTYPTKLTWFKAKQGLTELLQGHTVNIEGGLVTYQYPKDYQLPAVESTHGAFFIRALNCEGKMLQIHNHNYKDDMSDGLKFGFWGEVDTLELLICEEWIVLEKEIGAVVTPELIKTKVLDESLIEMSKQMGMPVEDEDNYIDQYDEPESIIYSLSVSVNIEHKKGYEYVWTTALLGNELFTEKALDILIEVKENISLIHI